jgi:carbonic anhydrase
MGHTNCGAVKGAIDKAELGNLTHLLNRIQPAIEAVKDVGGPRTSKNLEYVDAVARKNVELTIDNIRKNSPVLREMETAGTIKLARAMYSLKTAMVDLF